MEGGCPGGGGEDDRVGIWGEGGWSYREQKRGR